MPTPARAGEHATVVNETRGRGRLSGAAEKSGTNPSIAALTQMAVCELS